MSHTFTFSSVKPSKELRETSWFAQAIMVQSAVALFYNRILWSTGKIPQNKCNTIKSNDGRKFDRFNTQTISMNAQIRNKM